MGQGLEIVYAAIDEVNEHLGGDEKITKAPETLIFGSEGGVDSLTIVNLVVAVEEEIQVRLGKSVTLVNEEVLAKDVGPFHSIETLASHIESLMG